MGDLWFVAWACNCSDVKGSPEALDSRCPGHDRPAEEGSPVQITPGVSTNLAHICLADPCTRPPTDDPDAATARGDSALAAPPVEWEGE